MDGKFEVHETGKLAIKWNEPVGPGWRAGRRDPQDRGPGRRDGDEAVPEAGSPGRRRRGMIELSCAMCHWKWRGMNSHRAELAARKHEQDKGHAVLCDSKED